ncbi:hypothetical protein BD410DRAFT_708429, partial [Rickenella mellea]
LSGYVPDPFWSQLPYTNIHMAITPDILHQLYQGVISHLLSWCQDIIGADELDNRVKRFPPSHGIRHFKNGFTILSNVSGPERKQMAKLLLGIMAGAAPKDVIRCCRALLDFTFIAQYASHSEETLKYLDDALQTFHQHKEIFVTLGIREHFKIPKLHSLLHFSSSIRLFGSTDNYNTEMFERLHIDFAKEAYRASNHRDERPQMLRWLERREKINAFDGYLQWKH